MDIGHEPVYRLVDKLLAGDIVLPDIQREFVWSGSQIPRLLDSLNKQWPVGAVLLWRTSLEIPTKAAAVMQGAAVGGRPAILLDGQQRLSTLARVMAPGRVPKGERASDVRFHPGKMEFLNANAIQRRDPAWLPVSKMLEHGAQFRELIRPLGLDQAQEDEWTDRITGVAARIRGHLIPVQTVDVDGYETAAEIFNRVNTGGTRLSKGDLVMGAMAARWPGGRGIVEGFERALASKGWAINREVLLRIASVVALGSPNHIRLLDLKTHEDWNHAWAATEKAVLDATGFLRDDARIPSRSLLPTEYVALLPSVFLHDCHGALLPGDAAALTQWILTASAFGHYSGSLETTLAADVGTLRDGGRTHAEVLAALIRAAQEPRAPGAKLSPDDLKGRTRKSPFLRLLELRAAQQGARNWVSNKAITWDPNHYGLAVEVHHIFPKAWMRAHGKAGHPELDTLANFAFLSKWDNIQIADEDPAAYLARSDAPTLRSQWIPTDASLWSVDRFDEFCAARRVLLADAINDMLGLTRPAALGDPIGIDEVPEPEVGAWGEPEGTLVG